MKRHRRANGNLRFDDLEDWVRPMDVVKYLSISRSSLYELVRAGILPSKRLGRSIRIPKHALDPDANKMASV